MVSIDIEEELRQMKHFNMSVDESYRDMRKNKLLPCLIGCSR